MVIRPSLEKTAQWRVVPIHSHVIAQGFLEYVDERRKLNKPLFYDPDRSRGGKPGNRPLLLRSQSLRYESPVRFLFLRKRTNGRSLSSGVQSQGLFLPFPQYAMWTFNILAGRSSDGGSGVWLIRPPTSPHPLLHALLPISASL
jgi:hypothetical protein